MDVCPLSSFAAHFDFVLYFHQLTQIVDIFLDICYFSSMIAYRHIYSFGSLFISHTLLLPLKVFIGGSEVFGDIMQYHIFVEYFWKIRSIIINIFIHIFIY